jgi:hypothetical protein
MKSSAITKLNSILTVIALCCTLQNAFAGEKKTVTLTYPTGKVTQRLALPVSDQPGHEIYVQTREDLAATSNDPDFEGSTVVTTSHADVVKGSGTVSGYTVRTLKSGDKIYVKYQGATIKRSGEGDNWKVTAQVPFEVTGGTGKYANAKGTGTGVSEVGPSGGTVNTTFTIEY